ncbi:hypothetical protein [Synechococcus elongatus]|uniref:hypothetical protein n=1 Tax=Synechococcus elongatus TaxID=32046 RepID=UPI000F7F16FA|nr:hypothetical protein [Synechococcus elongatus]
MSKRMTYNAYTGDNEGGFGGASREFLEAAKKAGLETRGGFVLNSKGQYLPDEDSVYREILGRTFGGYGDDIDDNNYADIRARVQAGDFNEEQGNRIKGVVDSLTDDKRGTFASKGAEDLATKYFEGVRSQNLRAQQNQNQGNQSNQPAPSGDPVDKRFQDFFGPAAEQARDKDRPERDRRSREQADAAFGNAYQITQRRSLLKGEGYAQSINQNVGADAFRLADNYRRQEQSRFGA